MDIEFFADVGLMGDDCFDADIEDVGGFLVRVSLRNQFQDLFLAVR